MTRPCPFGSHRAEGKLPQPAWRVDNTTPPFETELQIDVEVLNLDSSSMRQLAEAANGDPDAIAARIEEIVRERGKMHNPVTGSGGVLIGRVAHIGAEFPSRDLQVGTEICTMVSLSLTPLKIERITGVDIARAQVFLEGKAILFASGLYARLPQGWPREFAMALFDVAGAPASVLKIAASGETVAVMGGGGKAGLLCLAAARERVGSSGRVIAVDASPRALDDVKRLGLADATIEADLGDPLRVHAEISRITDGRMADLVVDTANIAGCEAAGILSCRQGGRLYMFNMATSFQTAALTAEGVGRDIGLLIGNGYTENWVTLVIDLVERWPDLKRILNDRYAT